MATTQLSKQDYLKKYLSDGDKKKKKKKKTTQSSIIKSRIIDDDIDLKNMRVVNSDELEIYDLAEEAPQIAGFIDERPEEVRLTSEFRSTKKWKIVTDEFGIEDVKVVPIEDNRPKEEEALSVVPGGSRESDVPSPSGRKDSDGRASLSKKQLELDSSPPRKPAKGDDSDASPPRKIKKEPSDSDASPPRRSKRNDSEHSPRRRSHKNYDSDMSPPRKIKREKSSDSDNYQRKRFGKRRSPHSSPIRRIKKEKSDSDVSPPRRSRKNHDSDLSPARRAKKEKPHSRSSTRKMYDSDESPPRRRGRNRSDSDSSPRGSKNRKEKYQRDKNMSSSGKGTTKRAKSKSPAGDRHKRESEKRISKGSERDPKATDGPQEIPKSKHTLTGKKSGLQNAEELRKEIEQEKRRQKEADADVPDRNVAVVVRDRKTGLRIDPKEEARKRREKEEKDAEKVAKYAVWGKGVKQVQESQDKLKDDLYEMSKPLARYADDKDLDDLLKNKEWEGDPMLEYIRSKKKKKESVNVRPEYQGSYMPNRFGIKPGYRWDGVDRSNGYERKWFEEQNAKKAREEEAFKWSTADM